MFNEIDMTQNMAPYINADSFRALLSLTQKIHFKSAHMQKLHLALDVYRGLGTIPQTRADTLTKVASMLLHPFPKVVVLHCSFLHLSDTRLDSHDCRRSIMDSHSRRFFKTTRLEFTTQRLETCC